MSNTLLWWKVFKKKVFQVLYRITLLPFIFLFEMLTYTLPFMIIILNVWIYLIPPIVLVFLLFIIITSLGYSLNSELILYLSFLFVYTFYVTCNKLMLRVVAKFSIARYKNSTKLKPYNIKEITQDLLSQDNMKAIIYGFNFIVIILINVSKFQNLEFYDSISVFERPILQSLVTFIAFDRALTLFKGLTFKLSQFFQKILNGINVKKDSLNQ